MGSVCSRRNSPTLLVAVPVPAAPIASPTVVGQSGRLVSMLLRIRFLRKLWNELGQPGGPGNLRKCHWEGDLDFAKYHRHRLSIFWPEGSWQEVLQSSRARCFALRFCPPNENREVILVPDTMRVPPPYQSWLCCHPLRRGAREDVFDADVLKLFLAVAVVKSLFQTRASSFLGRRLAWRPRGPATQLKPGDPATVALEAKIAPQTPRVGGCGHP